MTRDKNRLIVNYPLISGNLTKGPTGPKRKEMVNEKKEIKEFRKTMLTDFIARDVESGYLHNLTWLFDEYPVFEVRNAVLRHWLNCSIKVAAQDVDWIEQRIIDLVVEEQSGSRLWRDLLNWYVFNTNTEYLFSDRTDLVSRALEFATGITKLEEGLSGLFRKSDILKIIAARLENTPHIYQNLKTPSLKPFLESFLVREYQSKYDIIDYEMVDVKRVIRCVIAVCDWGLLPHLEKVLAKVYQSRENLIKTKPKKYDYRKEVEILQTEVLLKETIRFFREKIEEGKDK